MPLDLEYDPETELLPEILHLRVGMCLFTGVPLFRFNRNDLPLRPEYRGGRSYAVGYADDYDSLYDKLVAPALSEAIESGCQIVMFPEYVIKPSFLSKIKAQLQGVSNRNKLSLIVAGSGWVNGDNNICVLLRSNGTPIGQYYKYSPYCDSENKYVEHLSTPGKECMLADIEGLGRVLPSLCKDYVSDDGYTISLANALNPQVICAPAYSGSIARGFDYPLCKRYDDFAPMR